MQDIQKRFAELEAWALSFASALEVELRAKTALPALHCFVLDQFQAAFPEEHIARKTGAVFIALRLSIDLQSMDPHDVKQLKAALLPKIQGLSLLRENFGDSATRLDFDWHVSEDEKRLNEGREFASKVMADSLTLVTHLNALA